MTNFLKILLFTYLLLINTVFADTLVMAYRINERPPLIGSVDDNSGLYFDLYSHAANKIGYELKIVRKPKKRILLDMKNGIIDFYPGFTFTKERTHFAYYIENGLPGGDIGISLNKIPLINNLNDLKGKNVLFAAGGPWVDLLANRKDINKNEVSNLSIEKAVTLIQLKRADFYIYNKLSIEYYLKVNKIGNIKMHPNCCGGKVPMYLGFSRTSDKFKEYKNPYYDNTKEITINNTPTLIDKESIAYKFSQVLEEMKNSGYIDELYDKYYK